MAAQTLSLELVTPDREVLRAQVEEIQLPGRDGYLGILPGHAPLLTELGAGVLSYHQGGQVHFATALLGFAEVLGDRVIVLAERAERAEEIDLARARAAMERAEKRLVPGATSEADFARDQAALQRALVRVQAAAKGGFHASQ
jgi:F-type H+-transporting ATPase subunit epsilon